MARPLWARPGKVGWLCRALEETAEPLEASLQRYYGLRLSDFPKRESWRRLWVLASNLPPDSPYVVAVTDGESIWGLTDQLLAGVFDTLRVANWQRSGKKTGRPQPLERPGVGRKKQRLGGEGRTVAEIRAFLDGTDGRRWVDRPTRATTVT